MSLRSVSYGGGVQSTALLVLAAQRTIDFPLFLFANVGDDSEHPDTLAYVRDIAIPYGQKHGIEVVELQRTMRDGTPETLMDRIDRRKSTIPIPMRMEPSGAPGNRQCTLDFKVQVIRKHLKRLGATAETPARVAVGFSIDEYQRVKPSRYDEEVFEHPLIDLEMTRQDCMNLIRDADLPVPNRSACYFCPFHTPEEWRTLARKRPDLFAKSVELERKMHERGQKLGRGEFWLTRFARPLDQVVDGNQEVLFEDDHCDVGHCFT